MVKNITIVVEDEVQLNIVKKLIKVSAPEVHIGRVLGMRGNSYIKNGINAFNEAAKIVPYVIITDLDSYRCPTLLINDWFYIKKSPNLLFNIAVKEAEAWLLADRKSFATFFGIAEATIGRNPEAITDPKRHIVTITKKSQNRAIREGLLPQGTAKVGKLYNTILGEYISSSWNIFNAAQNSKSLSRLISKIKSI